MRVSVLIVNWNSRDLLLTCLAALRDALRQGVDEVIVVDNGSHDGSAEIVRMQHPWAILIENDRNVGYARANNQAFARCGGEYVLLLNPDAEVGSDTLEVLVQTVNALPSAGAVTAKLVSGSGEMQHYIHTFPTLADMLIYYTFLRRLLPGVRRRVEQRYFMQGIDLSRLRTVPQPPGACLLLRRAVLGDILFDEQFPLYFNDVDLCKRIWAGGSKIYYTPDATVRHTPNKGGLERAGSLLQIEHAVSLIRYFRKHHSAWQQVSIHIMLVLHFTLAYGMSLAKKALGKVPNPVFTRPGAHGVRLLLMLIRCRSFFDEGDARWD